MQSFIIDAKEYIEFQKSERYLSREVVDRTFEEIEFNSIDSSPKALVRTISDELKTFVGSTATDSKGMYDIKCISLQVAKDDGMTWCAEKISGLLNRQFNQFSKHKKCIRGYDHDGLPLITKLIPENRIRKILKKELLNKGTDYSKIFIALAVATLTIVINILTGLVNNPNIDFENFKNGSFWILFGIILMLTFIAQELYTKYVSKETDKIDESIKKALDKEIDDNSDKFHRLIEVIANRLHPKDFRITIIDGFSNLDILTRKVIETYFLKYDSRGGASEFWIILDSIESGNGSFNRIVLNEINNWFFKHRTKSYSINHISSTQKRKLLELLHLPEEYESYRLVKTICRGKLANSNWNIEALQEYRLQNPKNNQSYDEFDLFFLLSLVSSPSNMYFSKDYYINMLSVQGRVRSEVLKEVLPGTKLLPSEFKEKINLIFDDEKGSSFNALLSKLTESVKNGKTVGYMIIPEIKYTLINNYKLLNLPSPKLGNLFWSLYWGDNIKALKEAAWLRKLSHHLSNKGLIYRFNEDIISKIYNRLFDIYLEAIEGCLETGLYSEIPNLLDDLLDLSTEHSFEEESRITALLRRCWQSFILLGYPRIMEILLDVSLAHVDTLMLATDNNPTNNEKIFWEMIPCNHIRKSKYNLLTLTRQSKQSKIGIEELISLKYYSDCYAIWVRLIFASYTAPSFYCNEDYKNKLIYLRPYENEFNGLLSSLKFLTNRLLNKKIANMIDLLSISNVIWNIALTFDLNSKYYREKQRKYSNVSFKEDKGELSGIELAHIVEDRQVPFVELENFKESLKAFHDLAIVLNKLIEKGDKNNSKNEDNAYLDQTLAIDIYSNVMISIIVIYDVCNNYDKDLLKLDLVYLNSINSIVNLSNSLLSYHVPEINEASELIFSADFHLKVNSLLRLCTITWRGLNLENLAHCLELKGLQFNTMINNYKDTGKIVKAGSELIKQENIYGVFANLLVSNVEKESIELKSEYFYSAFDIVLNNNYGEHIIKEMMLLLIMKYFKVGKGKINLSFQFQKFVNSGHFRELLLSIKDEDIKGFIMKYFVMEYLVQDSGLRTEIELEIITHIENFEEGQVKDDLLAYVDSKKIVHNINNNKNLSISETITNWSFDKISESYASILNAFVINGHYEEVKEDCFNLLRKNFNNYSYNVFLFLANNIGKQLTDDDINERKIVSTYLENGMQTWSDLFPTDLNIEMYSRLRILIPEKQSFYTAEIKKWFDYQSVINEIKVKYFLKERRYFDLYKFCYKILKNFGLKSDIKENLLEKEFLISLADAEVKLNSWLMKSKGIPPKPFISIEDNLLISSKFLIVGHYLFETELYKDGKYTKLRMRFNLIAEKHRGKLFDLIKNLPEAPMKFKEIIKKYSNQLDDNYSTPEELN